jgi:transposase
MTMNYFAGLDVSLEKTHICVLDRNGTVVLETSSASTPEAISSALEGAPACKRVVFETGRMAPMLYHGLADLDVPVICIESRQAYQALKTLATHKTDRNDARGLAQLARTGFFKPVHVKSLPSHAVRALIMARKKLVGQRITLENQIRGLAVVFGVRLPRGLSPVFVKEVIAMSDGIAGLSSAMRGLVAARDAVLAAVAAIDADMKRLVRASDACRQLMTIPGVGPLTALAFTAAIDDPDRFRRSRDLGAYLGLVPRRYQSGEINYTGSISKVGDRRVRTLLYEAANVMLTRFKGQLKLKDWAIAIARRSNMRKARIALARRLAIIMHAMLKHGTEFKPA